jgi:NitT/TauT family transport system substrate-binding protein
MMGLAGLSVDDVELVELPFPDTPAALANKAIDAVPLPNPSAAKAIEDGSAMVLLEGDKIAGKIQNGVIYFGKRLLDPANREVGVRFLMAFLKAVRELQGEGWTKQENIDIISKYTGLPPEVIKTSSRSYQDPNCEFRAESLEDVQAYYVRRGYTEYTEPMPLSKVVDESFAKEAVKRIGKFEQ